MTVSTKTQIRANQAIQFWIVDAAEVILIDHWHIILPHKSPRIRGSQSRKQIQKNHLFVSVCGMRSDHPPCAVKIHLLQDYIDTTRAYAAAVSEFDNRLASTPLEDFSHLNRKLDKARRESEDARDRLARHTAEHHC